MTNHSYDEPAALEPAYDRRMTHAEAVLLCRYAKAACPQQAFDQYTPDAWSDLLSDLRYADCQVAIKAIVQRQPFVSPAEIRAEVKRVRNKRIGDFGILPAPPPNLSPAETSAWQRDLIRRIGDGEVTEVPDPPDLEKRDMRELLSGRTNELPTEEIASNADRVRAAAREARVDWTAAQKPDPEPLPEVPCVCGAGMWTAGCREQVHDRFGPRPVPTPNPPTEPEQGGSDDEERVAV